MAIERRCPFNKFKKCIGEDCVLFRKGVRFFDDKTREPAPFEMCGLNVLIDAAENQIMRLLGVQKEMNVLRNNVEQTTANLIKLGQAKKAIEHEIEHRVIQRLIEEGKPKEEIIEVRDSEAEEAEAEYGETQISED